MSNLIHRSALVAVALLSISVSDAAPAFCGFYVARAEAGLFNKASQVVLARDGNRTVITMASDYQGDVADFAMVVPVPTAIQREQIHIGRAEDVAHLDRYTAPRLVEYHDPDPCRDEELAARSISAAPLVLSMEGSSKPAADVMGVRIEARYSVGEYDIVILSAEQSDALVHWLEQNGYRMPAGAEAVVASYLARGMRFFVAKVNLEAHARAQRTRLRPLQIAYESRRFMLPIRLGMLNANGHQDLLIYTLTRQGRVETTNYPTQRLPSGQEIPVTVRERFGEFYTAMFDEQTRKAGYRSVFLEYAWDMGWCDPCAAQPLSTRQLRDLGAYWETDRAPNDLNRDTFVTRLHLRYDATGFPEDLLLHETHDRGNFQGRYIIRHPFTGIAMCKQGRHYRNVELPQRARRERAVLASLTGWDEDRMSQVLPVGIDIPGTAKRWWESLWRPEPGR